jgi:methylaspartate ammonia-lyase
MDLENKRLMREQITLGKKNVADYIKELKQKQEELKAFSESPVILGKRGASPEADMSNKRSQH